MNERAFLDDIAEHPDEDAPPLIFADWLEENGDPQRAEFIRLHIQYAPLDRDDPQHFQFSQKAGAIQQLRENEWMGEVKTLTGSHGGFHRGVLEHVRHESPQGVCR